jgi:hypothetical protein
MKPFGFWKDFLCLLACAAYALNRWLLAPHSASLFLHGYFNDLLLIPAALPLLLWVQRKLDLRPHDAPPSFAEVFLHLVIWTIICEVIGPRMFHHSVGDPFDALAYAAGGLVAWVWWNQVPRLRLAFRFRVP